MTMFDRVRFSALFGGCHTSSQVPFLKHEWKSSRWWLMCSHRPQRVRRFSFLFGLGWRTPLHLRHKADPVWGAAHNRLPLSFASLRDCQKFCSAEPSSCDCAAFCLLKRVQPIPQLIELEPFYRSKETNKPIHKQSGSLHGYSHCRPSPGSNSNLPSGLLQVTPTTFHTPSSFFRNRPHNHAHSELPSRQCLT
jgi:hypothetical protein